MSYNNYHSYQSTSNNEYSNSDFNRLSNAISTNVQKISQNGKICSRSASHPARVGRRSQICSAITLIAFSCSQFDAEDGQPARHIVRHRAAETAIVSVAILFRDHSVKPIAKPVLILPLSRHDTQHYTNQLSKDTNNYIKEINYINQSDNTSDQVGRQQLF